MNPGWRFLSGLTVAAGLLLYGLPAPAGADAFNGLDCGAGYVRQEGAAPNTCSATLQPGTGGSGSATFTGYADGGFSYFGSSLHIEANNFQHVGSGWWNPLAMAGWDSSLTFWAPPGYTLGTLDLEYWVRGSSYVSSNFYAGGSSTFPIRGVMAIGSWSSNWSTRVASVYEYMNLGSTASASFDRHVQLSIPIVLTGRPQYYTAWLRSEVLLEHSAEGLLPVMNGKAYADFAHTAELSRLRVLDASGADITDSVSIQTQTGGSTVRDRTSSRTDIDAPAPDGSGRCGRRATPLETLSERVRAPGGVCGRRGGVRHRRRGASRRESVSGRTGLLFSPARPCFPRTVAQAWRRIRG